MFTKRCLEVAGLVCNQMIEFESAVAVREHMKDPELDLMVIDLVMPKMNGRQLLEERLKIGAKFPVIVVSSAVNRTEEDELKKLGALVVLKKPMNPASALGALEIVGVH
jgi:DNA-binding NtrC family response regulator